MNYKSAIAYIHGLERFGSKPGLERIKALTERLGNPQDKLKFVHIAGTNGKGSTAAFIASMLSCAGYRTGLYTSPFIEQFNERIQINGTGISDKELTDYVEKVKAAIDDMTRMGADHPTEFEVITALALLYYYEKECDVVVFEVGLGGRFDATNIIHASAVSVITKIAMDHTDILGDTLSKIAYEKAGIIKNDGIVVTYPQEKSALDTIKSVCQERKAKLVQAVPEELINIQMEPGWLAFDHPQYGRVETAVVGAHQVYNASVAIKTIEAMKTVGFEIGDEHIREGFRRAAWPGRFELLLREPDFYIDGAHNPDGIRSFIDTFNKIYSGEKAIVIFGVMKDKEVETMVRELSSITERFIAVRPDTPRALSTGSLTKVMMKYCNNVEDSDTIKEAVEKSILLASKEGIIAALGSLYYIGQVRTLIRTEFNGQHASECS